MKSNGRLFAGLFVCIILTVIFTLSGCKTLNAPQEDDYKYNLEVTNEPFESFDVIHSESSIFTCDNEEELFKHSEIVVIGMLEETFTDGESVFYGLSGERVNQNSGNVITSVSTLRNLIVLDVLKGENVGDSLTYADMAVYEVAQDGTEFIKWLPTHEFIPKRNVKYIFYLNESTLDEGVYYSHPHYGKVNVDGLDQNGKTEYMTEERYEQVKSRFVEYFEKYDRSDEITNK